jgi:hypothetical protein
MSKNEKPKKVLKNTVFSRCDHDALNYIFGFYKIVTIYFFTNSDSLGKIFSSVTLNDRKLAKTRQKILL